MSAKPTLTVTKDISQQVNALLKQFKKDIVLVGIPQTDSPRGEDDNAPINNATLLAINNFGSPGQNIPARPVMEIGIKKAQGDITEQFKKIIANPAAGYSDWQKYAERAGIIASNSIKKVITDQDGIAPPAPGTLRAREHMGKNGFKGTKSLLVTAQMRNAITYVVNPGANAHVVVTKGQAKAVRD